MTEKVCSGCKEVKSIAEFYRDTKSKDGLTYICKECNRLKSARWLHSHEPRRHPPYYRPRPLSPEIARERALRWYHENHDRAKELARKRYALIMQTERGHLNDAMRKGIGQSLCGNKGGRSWKSLVDYTIDQLKAHIEKQFKDGMSWENYGTHWHIDHKIPIAVFNFEKPEDIDFRLCWSLKNLQPLEAKENLRKNAKISEPFQPSLMIAV